MLINKSVKVLGVLHEANYLQESLSHLLCAIQQVVVKCKRDEAIAEQVQQFEQLEEMLQSLTERMSRCKLADFGFVSR